MISVTDNTVITVDYVATDDAGRRIDDGEPMRYIHGRQQILPALEKGLSGATVGEHRCIELPPDEAYGPRLERLVFEAPPDYFPKGIELKPGQVLRTRHQNREFPLRVVEVEADRVVVDGNHPLAGRTLHFDCRVRSVRPATAAELRNNRPEG